MVVVTTTVEVILRITTLIENNTLKALTNKSWAWRKPGFTGKVYSPDDLETRGSKLL